MSIKTQEVDSSSSLVFLPFDILCEIVPHLWDDVRTLQSLALLNSAMSHEAHKLLWYSRSLFVTHYKDVQLPRLGALRRRKEFVRQINITSFTDEDALGAFELYIVPALLILDAMQTLHFNFLFPENLTSHEPPPLGSILDAFARHPFPPSIKSLIITIPISNPKTFDSFDTFWNSWSQQLTSLDLSIVKDVSSPIDRNRALEGKDFPHLVNLALGNLNELSLVGGKPPLQRLVIRQHATPPFAPPTVEDILGKINMFKETLLDLELHQGFPEGPSALPFIVDKMPHLERLYLPLKPNDNPYRIIHPKAYDSAILESLKAQPALHELYVTGSKDVLKSLQIMDYFRASPRLEMFGYGEDDGKRIIRPELYRRYSDQRGETSFTRVSGISAQSQSRRILPTDPEIPLRGQYPPLSFHDIQATAQNSSDI